MSRCLLPALLCCALSPLPTFAQNASASAQGLQCTITPFPHSEADLAYASGNPIRAEELFTAQLTAAPTPANYSGLVKSQLDQNHLPEALTTAQRAIVALPNSADAQALLGDALARFGQIPEAFDAYANALVLNRCSARAHAGVARLHDLAGRHASAAREFSFAHRLAPADPEITAAFLENLPPLQRIAPLRAFLAEHPQLPPDELNRLTIQSQMLGQHKLCIPSGAFDDAKFDLFPVLLNGRTPRGWGLKLRINDVAMPLLELDSSIAGIVLNPKDAEKAGVHPLDATQNPGSSATFVAIADHISIGDHEFRDCPVTVTSAFALADGNSLIGTDFFRDHLIHIDYPARLLTLAPLPKPIVSGLYGLTDPIIDPARKDWTPVYIAGPDVLIPTLINKKGPYLFALDTGVGHSVYSPAVTRSQLSETKDATLNLRGTSAAIIKVLPRDGGGQALVNVADVHGPGGISLSVTRPVKFPVLRYALNEIPDPTAVSFDISPYSHQARTEVSGLLGFALLSYYDIEINYRDGLARLVFDQNRRYHVTQNDERAYDERVY